MQHEGWRGLSQTELKGDPRAARQFILAAEEVGFDHMLVYDHVVGAEHAERSPPLAGPYTENDPFHDPFTLLAYAAAITKRIELVTSVVILPQRQTVLVAKQAADVALFSEGRLRLGVGTGWNWVEYQALNADWATRGPRMDEQIELLRQLWTGELISFHGTFHHLERASLVLRPERPIPIWMGGNSEASFRRAGRLGDGYVFRGLEGFDPAQWAAIQRHLDAEGRPIEAFGRELIVNDTTLGAEETAATLKRWADLGHTHGTVLTMRKGYTSVDQHTDFAADVLHRLSS